MSMAHFSTFGLIEADPKADNFFNCAEPAQRLRNGKAEPAGQAQEDRLESFSSLSDSTTKRECRNISFLQTHVDFC
jgi:hypothetical protein